MSTNNVWRISHVLLLSYHWFNVGEKCLNLLRAFRLSQNLSVCLTRFVRWLCQVNSRASHHVSYIIN